MFLRTSTALTALIWFIVPGGFAQTSTSSTPPSEAVSCTEAEHHQFDFWIGAWDLTWPGQNGGEAGHGTNSIRSVLDGCVVEEDFNGGTSVHLRGTSVSTFDNRSHKWKQTWVDNEGGYLDFIGEFKDGQMVLQRQAKQADGTTVLQRMVFKNITPTGFDWSWERSQDAGKTWQVLWPIHYQRKALVTAHEVRR
jgi:Protein of unknown function (DUF1579)